MNTLTRNQDGYNPKNVTESNFERKIPRIVKKYGWLVYKLKGDGTNGLPDRMYITGRGSVVFAENKQEGKTLRPLQAALKGAWKARGVNYYPHPLTNVEELTKMIEYYEQRGL